MQPKNNKIIISGGGTGGHIYPAIAIANALRVIQPQIEILFVGAKGRMEMEKVPAAGYTIKGLWISGFQRRLTVKNLLFPLKVLWSLLKARSIIKSFKPDVVVGVGGYASGPTLRMANNLKIPTLIQEQNSYPGITNKILAAQVSKICVAYPDMHTFFPKDKIIVTGNPIRQDIIDLKGKEQEAYEYFNLQPTMPVVLIIGGSLGARTINESMELYIDSLVKKNIQIIWQTGKTFADKAKELSAKYDDKGVRIVEFISKMDYAYSIATIVVSRAGAISISELCAVAKPAILIPSPNVSEDHQTKNVMALVKHNAAIMLKDVDAANQLGEKIIELLNDKNRQNLLAHNIKQLAFVNAADIIAKEIIKLSAHE